MFHCYVSLPERKSYFKCTALTVQIGFSSCVIVAYVFRFWSGWLFWENFQQSWAIAQRTFTIISHKRIHQMQVHMPVPWILWVVGYASLVHDMGLRQNTSEHLSPKGVNWFNNSTIDERISKSFWFPSCCFLPFSPQCESHVAKP